MMIDELVDLGQSLITAGRCEEAVNVYTTILLQDAKHTLAWSQRGAMLYQLGRPFDALLNFDRGLACDDSGAALWNNRGGVLLVLGHHEAAYASFLEAVNRNPDFDRGWINVSLACRRMGRWDEALQALRHAAQIAPHDAEIHYNIAHLLLHDGQWDEGWQEYIWWRKIAISSAFNRSIRGRRWEGEPIAGKKILAFEEQGYGDTIHWVRYLPLLAQKGAKVSFAVRRHVERLCRASLRDVAIVPPDADGGLFDYITSVVDLPRLFKTQPHDVPGRPYLRSESGLRAQWRRRLEPLKGRKIGFCWAGGRRELVPHHSIMDAERSMPFAFAKPLGDVPNCVWIGLQKDELTRAQAAAAGMSAAAPALPVHDVMDDVVDFADTAALIDELDLIISVDTAVAHLAGALGKPVWLLNRYDGDWRWGHAGVDSAWYPSMRIFRQPTPGDWSAVIAEVAAALST